MLLRRSKRTCFAGPFVPLWTSDVSAASRSIEREDYDLSLRRGRGNGFANYGCVTAPSDADETVAAYFASTPFS